MADFQVAFNWVMDNEDAQRQYLVCADAPPGAHAISGINSEAFPEDFARIAALAQVNRPAAVEAFYREHFWNQWLAALESDEVAKRVMDCSFNQGGGTGVRLLQEAVNLVRHSLIETDGLWGPVTLAAANACDETELTNAFRGLRTAAYKDLAAARPSLARYLPGWLARAGK